MEASFWHQRWQSNQIGFHESEVNPKLTAHFPALNLAAGKRVFVPLCGKTLDIAWLLAQDYSVAAVELSELAIEQLFDGLSLTPEVAVTGNLKHYSASGIDVFAGDIFNMTAATLGPVDAVYDRAALVALPLDLRIRYTNHLCQIVDNAPQLLITFEYDQSKMQGPPFSISAADVTQYYHHRYRITALHTADIPGGLKGRLQASETVWLLGN